ncbi:wall-associated receptor kinase 3-like [Oryza brachyantha]|uniref:wall-associated receptor kinase 3-like n=1 Tax=Oryza brachyantha TaxID=4533 RepID=UPI001ADA69C7|nr:wall-associated receptor kinase 3-like [Oryza brachyantha]
MAPSLVIAVAMFLQAATMAATALSLSLLGCPSSCGSMVIPYPFGVGEGCHLAGFAVTCNRSYHQPKLFLGDGGGATEVLEISILNSTVVVSSAFDAAKGEEGAWGRGLGGAFYLQERRNRLVVVGCNLQAALLDDDDDGQRDIVAACTTICGTRPAGRAASSDDSCTGVGCCQASIYLGLTSYSVQLSPFGTRSTGPPPTTTSSPNLSAALVFIADSEWFAGNASKLGSSARQPGGGGDMPAVPAVLDWAIGKSGCPANGSSDTACRSSNSYCRSSTSTSHGGYSCRCSSGYQGNPYVAGVKVDIDECAMLEEHPCYGECTNKPGSFSCSCPGGTHGDALNEGGCEPTILLVVIGGSSGVGIPSLFVIAMAVAYILKARKAKKLRATFFKQNRGLLLQQLVDKVIAERMMFTLEELEKATNRFDETRKLGSGGHGTVYKGILLNGGAVAIKESNMAVRKEIDDFINEVAILSQINHRNVVQLFGCCLETQVPLLVYEFISNGTLSDHLHVEGPKSLSWMDRLRIALEAASALAYLHSSASISIIHRDVKSANILLDSHLTAKVSDFGASRGIPVDQAGVTTTIQGTFGYLDPEYYQTGRLTDKSDVYSFGVIIVEMLTRKKPTVFTSSDNVGLIALFNLLMIHDSIYEILDPQVVTEGMENVNEVAALASECLSLKGEERPTMRQVEVRLERMLGSNKDSLQGLSAELHSPQTQLNNRNTTELYIMEQDFLLSASFPR